MDLKAEQYYQKGWLQFPYDPELFDWVQEALPIAEKAVNYNNNSAWLRCGGTWFVGVNLLPNTASGAIGNTGPFNGLAVDFIRNNLNTSKFKFDQAQISVCYPGYPQSSEDESDNAYKYRVNRDAAHVDGFKAQGSQRRRFLDEYHYFILGIPLVNFSADAAPFVVWEGSHEIIRLALIKRFRDIPAHHWTKEDVTEIYQKARKEVFQKCKRVEISAKPGEAFLAHRLTVHGVAPWGDNATADSRGRMICYFRPEGKEAERWLRDR